MGEKNPALALGLSEYLVITPAPNRTQRHMDCVVPDALEIVRQTMGKILIDEEPQRSGYPVSVVGDLLLGEANAGENVLSGDLVRLGDLIGGHC